MREAGRTYSRIGREPSPEFPRYRVYLFFVAFRQRVFHFLLFYLSLFLYVDKRFSDRLFQFRCEFFGFFEEVCEFDHPDGRQAHVRGKACDDRHDKRMEYPFGDKGYRAGHEWLYDFQDEDAEQSPYDRHFQRNISVKVETELRIVPPSCVKYFFHQKPRYELYCRYEYAAEQEYQKYAEITFFQQIYEEHDRYTVDRSDGTEEKTAVYQFFRAYKADTDFPQPAEKRVDKKPRNICIYHTSSIKDTREFFIYFSYKCADTVTSMKRIVYTLLSCIFLVVTGVYAEDTVHILQKGETMYSLSRKYNVSVDSLCEFNGIADPSKLKAGQVIRIPSCYTVQAGDTLYAISRKFSISVDDLLEANNLTKNSVIKPGQTLLFPDNAVQSGTTAGDTPAVNPGSSVLSNPLVDPRSYETRKVDSSIIWPVKAREVSYLSGKLYGVSLTAQKSEKVTAINSGSVISIGPYRGFGQVVFVQSSSGHIYVYAGLESISVKKGDSVSFGDVLGTLGNDVLSGKAQLNFMVYNNGQPMDPATAPRG